MDPRGDMGESEQQKDGGTGGFRRISSIRLDDETDDERILQYGDGEGGQSVLDGFRGGFIPLFLYYM